MATKISKIAAITILLSIGFTGIRAQDTVVASVNNDFTMEIHRNSSAVWVVISFIDPAQYSSLFIEDGRWNDGEFRQCAYVDMSQNANSGRVEAKVNFPLPLVNDSYYRVRAVSIDGTEKIYPVVLLPGKIPDSKIFPPYKLVIQVKS